MKTENFFKRTIVRYAGFNQIVSLLGLLVIAYLMYLINTMSFTAG